MQPEAARVKACGLAACAVTRQRVGYVRSVITDFWLGTHVPKWLAQTDVPLMVSHRRLAMMRNLPRARARWVLDSGGFTELHLHGGWTIDAPTYARIVAGYIERIGNLVWAAPQDWVCEPVALKATGLTVAEHQRLTVANFVALRDLGPFVPVLQGWEPHEYMRHVDAYEHAGVDLSAYPVVGVGSVHGRAHDDDVLRLLVVLSDLGLPLHGFGVKRLALRQGAQFLASADSTAWSYRARRAGTDPSCVNGRKQCQNCLHFALDWRAETLRQVEAQPPRLF